MNVPVWLTFLVASVVILFGLYRIKIAFRSNEKNAIEMQKKGLYAQPRRRHAVIGLLYLFMGVALISGALGHPIIPPLVP